MSTLLLWMRGLARRHRGRLLGTACGVAVAVALLASLGSFLAASKATMTRQAVAGVAVDWQVLVATGSDPLRARQTVASTPGVQAALPVGYAASTGLSATAGGATQSTGAAVALGLPGGYEQSFPQQIRSLAGSAATGTPAGLADVLLAQQTAANLHIGPGAALSIGRAGLPPVTLRVARVVDLPQANSLFQSVGAPSGGQPSAPPDNVLLLPAGLWHQLFDPVALAQPDQVRTQVHVQLTHALPHDPAAAYTAALGAGHNLESRLAGTGMVGNNLAAALSAARSDALYAQVLFVFLGLPGAILAALLTAALAGAGADRRRREQGLLRARGATSRTLLRLAGAEAALVGVTGSLLGLAVAALVGRSAFGSAAFGASGGQGIVWAAGASAAGLLIAAATMLLPPRRDLRETTVAASRGSTARAGRPVWLRYPLDLLALVGAGAVFAVTSRAGYTLVLAPEGSASISVSYWAFAGPALLWLGSGLLAWRLSDLLLGRGRRLLAAGLRPVAGNLAGTVAASMGRQRRVIARSIVLLALAISFAGSTATFNATYRQQAEVDARLSNGGDVTATYPAGARVSPAVGASLATVPGVRRVEPLQHRFAYIGTDLQDLYGVRPTTVRAAVSLQNAYFTGGSAAQLMSTLARQPDSILVSAETVKDYQLRLGDPITLRLQDSRTRTLTPVSFRYAGIVKEFPTAPKDSFFITNAGYVAARTGTDTVSAFILDTAGSNPAAVAGRVRALTGPAAAVTDITSTRTAVGSSLTAVDLAGLTRVELAFAVVLAVAAGGLLLGLGLAERRRTFALAAALGARPRQLAGFVYSEASLILLAGLGAGAVTGTLLSRMLVTVLTGVFDPAPAHLAVPWGYLAAVVALTVAAVLGAVAALGKLLRRPVLTELRDL